MKIFFILTFSFLAVNVFSQPNLDISYYLGEQEFNSEIPSPKEVLGWEVGTWHVSHDLLLLYMQLLGKKSPKAKFIKIGKSHEDRTIGVLAISSPQNINNLEAIRTKRLKVFNDNSNQDIPIVIYQGNSIHGNEPSGANASLIYAYNLLANESNEISTMLENVVVLLDPCFNPDGLNRFASWVNSHKNNNLNGDAKDREYNEAWPQGRTNHYWFDLNRDWLPLRHPESRARIELFQSWKPEILTDHHEMGSDATFFFQPGIPERTNPITPSMNQQLTKEIAEYHKASLDKIGSLYYSEEGYDDFYYGKGSTYPDIQGCIGILFEQASSRGHFKQTQHGLMPFSFTIKNQLVTQLSTFKAAYGLKQKLLNYKRNFFINARKEALKLPNKGFVFAEDKDLPRINEFLDILNRHRIIINKMKKGATIKDKKYKNAYFVDLDQNQSKTIRSIFETSTKFKDSIFYDISAWTFPLSFNLAYQGVKTKPSELSVLKDMPIFSGIIDAKESDYAFIYKWDSHFSPAGLYYLLSKGIKVKVIESSSFYKTRRGKLEANSGDILITTQMQSNNKKILIEYLKNAAKIGKTTVCGLISGSKIIGKDLGSRSFDSAKLPKIALIVGDGISSYDAGEIWYLFDYYYHIPITKIDIKTVIKKGLGNFSTVILANGKYGSCRNAITKFVNNGGNLIAFRGAVKWLADNKMIQVKFKDISNFYKNGKYKYLTNNIGSMKTGGAIFEMKIDNTHPIFFGYDENKIATFRNTNLFLEASENKFANPACYTKNPLLSGYVHRDNLNLLKNSPVVHLQKFGKGQIISMIDNTNFRAYWWGTDKMLANAVFFGHLINRNSMD